MDPNRLGALFMVFAMACFALEDALLKAAMQSVPAPVAMMVFGLSGAVLFALFGLVRGVAIVPPFTRQMAIRSVIELGGRLFYSLSLAFAGLGVTSAILQATPLVVIVGAVVFFGERVGWRRWLAIFVGVLGVLLVLRPATQGFDATALLALFGMLGFAGRDLATRAAPLKTTNAQLGVAGMLMIAVAGVVAQLVLQTPLTLPPASTLPALAGTTVFGVIAYGALTQAMRTGEVSVVTPFRYTRLVFALILAALMFNERPDWVMIAGSVLIVGSGLFTLARARRMM